MQRLDLTERRADSLYAELAKLVKAGEQARNSARFQQVVAALDGALEDEGNALEQVLERRLPSLQATEAISERADALLRKHGAAQPSAKGMV